MIVYINKHLWVEVEGTYHRPHPGDRETPPEYPSYDLDRIINASDLIDLLDWAAGEGGRWYETLEKLIIENYER